MFAIEDRNEDEEVDGGCRWYLKARYPRQVSQWKSQKSPAQHLRKSLFVMH
jgi:hypothetical protein